tara:strand:+ start:215 stop:760 length:546 start_codon:yes stop_codon:yes gene_type:complete
MSFSSFKNSKLIFESFRKFVNEQDEVDLLAGEEEEVFEMPPEPERTTYGSQEEYTAAKEKAIDDQTKSDQEAEAARLARRAAADKRSQETDVIVPDDVSTDIKTTGPDALSRATKVYLSSRDPEQSYGADSESTGILTTLFKLKKEDPEAHSAFARTVQKGKDEMGGVVYSFIPQEKPTDL